MADDEERIKAEKLAAAKKRVSDPTDCAVWPLFGPNTHCLQVAQLQKKKKTKKATTGTDTPKETEPAEASTEAEPAEGTPAPESPPADAPAEADKQDEPAAESVTAAPEQPEELQGSQSEQAINAPVESPVEPMPPAPTSPGPDAEPLPKLDTPRANHGRQPSLSIQSKMRSSSFRKTSVSQGSVSPSPSSTIKSPGQSLPPLTGDGDSVHEVFRKQSTKIEELEKENKRLEKDLSDATTRWRKTEEQVEDLREASVDGAELREQLKKAEEQVASIESLVCILGF
jgi:hypothetical protein